MSEGKKEQEQWIKVDNNRVMKVSGTLVVLKPSYDMNIVPIFCPTCSMALKTSNDSAAYRKHQCCYQCAIKWADSQYFGWNKGWRPSTEEIQKAVSERKIRMMPIITLK